MSGFPSFQEVADSWNVFRKIFRKILTGARDESEGVIVMEESGEEADRKKETKRETLVKAECSVCTRVTYDHDCASG